MAAMEVDGTLDTLARGVITTATIKNDISNVNEYLASEHFTNTFGSSGLSDLLEADLSMACQPRLETSLDYICPDTNTETPRGATCGPLSPHEESNPSNQQAPSKNISLPAPNGELELRPASHKSKNRKRRSATPSNQLRARECHNLVEKHYRARLKTQFERLLAVLPAAQGRSLAGRDTAASLGQVLSRGQVLDMARNRISLSMVFAAYLWSTAVTGAKRREVAFR